jgi:hypothetical protein
MSNEDERLSDMVTRFAAAMRSKLLRKRREGYRGWEDPTDSVVLEILRDGLNEHVAKYNAGDSKQLIDIANYCAMLWNIDSYDEFRKK